jgi:cell division septation protein DedD
MRLRSIVAISAALLAMGASAGAVSPPGASGCPVFPSDNVWHADITKLPVHARSAAWIASMGGTAKRLHPDFGDSGDAMPYGIPYTLVSSSQQKVSIDFQYADESDPGPYPFGSDTPIEGGSDRHAIMIDKSTCTLYELYAAHYASGGSTAGSGAIWSLESNKLRPAGWTSADAAGLPIFAGLVRLDEVKVGEVDHAIRVTASATDRSYLWPARHQAGAAHNANLPPMGARFRLKQTFSLSGFRSDTRVILTAMKRYGMIVADNGSDWFFTGTAENGWSNDMLDELKTIPAGAFEAVDESSLMVDRNSGRVRTTSAAATRPKPKPKASVAVKPTTPKPSASPKPTPRTTATPSQTPTATVSPAPLAAAHDRAGGRGWVTFVVALVVTALAGLAFVRRRSVRSRP